MCPIGTGLGVMSLAEVRLQEGESIDNALRRFKRKVQTEDIIKEVKRHSYYLKPGEKTPSEAGSGAKTCSKKDSQRARLKCTNCCPCCQAAAFYFAGQSFFVTRCICPLEGPSGRPRSERSREDRQVQEQQKCQSTEHTSHGMQPAPACE